MRPFDTHQSLQSEHRILPLSREELCAVAQSHVDAGRSPDEAVAAVAASHYAVFDVYATDCPGYAGAVVVEIAGAAPSYFSIFIEEQQGSGLRKLDRAAELQS